MVISRLPYDFWSFGLQPANVLFSRMLFLKIAAACLAILLLWLLLFSLTRIYFPCSSDFPPSSLAISLSPQSLIQRDVFALSSRPVQHSHLPLSPDSTDICVRALAPVQLLSGSRCCPKLTCAGEGVAYLVWHITRTDQFTQQKRKTIWKNPGLNERTEEHTEARW